MHVQVNAALRRRRRRSLCSAFSFWSAWASKHAKLADSITIMHQHRRARLLHSALHGWQYIAAQHTDKRLMLQLCRDHMQRMRALACMMAWRQQAQLTLLHRHILGLALRKQTLRTKVRSPACNMHMILGHKHCLDSDALLPFMLQEIHCLPDCPSLSLACALLSARLNSGTPIVLPWVLCHTN